MNLANLIKLLQKEDRCSILSNLQISQGAISKLSKYFLTN